MGAWKVSRISGEFPNCLNSFQTSWTVSRLLEKFPGYLGSFQTAWKVSRISGILTIQQSQWCLVIIRHLSLGNWINHSQSPRDLKCCHCNKINSALTLPIIFHDQRVWWGEHTRHNPVKQVKNLYFAEKISPDKYFAGKILPDKYFTGKISPDKYFAGKISPDKYFAG